MKKVLIIGASGFIGKNLVNRLAKDKELFDVIEADENELNLVQPESISRVLARVKPDCVVNLAAIATLHNNDVQAIYNVNAFGVLNLLECLKNSNFKGRFLLASSALVYGHQTPQIISEDHPTHPMHHYACAKLLAENFCGMYREHFDITVFRLFNVVGCGHRPDFLFPKLVQHFRDRLPSIRLGNIDIARDYVDVRDICNFIAYFLQSARSVHCLHFSSCRATRIRDIIDQLSIITGHVVDVIKDQTFIRACDNPYQCGDNRTLQSLGLGPQYRLNDTLQWMLNEKENSSC